MALPRSLLCLLPVVLAVVMALSPAALSAAALLLFHELPIRLGNDPWMASVALMAKLPAPRTGSNDIAESVCEVASLFQEHWKVLMIRTGENLRAFRASCLRALPSLDPALRQNLEWKTRANLLVHSVGAPPDQPPNSYIEDWRTCGSGYARVAEADLPKTAREIFDKIGVRPLKPRRVKASEVRQALERAEVVTFDARDLIPARMFNTTIQDLHALHPNTVVFADTKGQYGTEPFECKLRLGMLVYVNILLGGGPRVFLEWLTEHGLTERILAQTCKEDMTLRDLAAMFDRLQPARFSMSMSWEEHERELTQYEVQTLGGMGIFGSNINVLRLPNWTKGELDMPRIFGQLGLEGLAEYAHNLLWVGASPGGLHWDIQDNILVQINSESQVFVVPANCSMALATGLGNNRVTLDWLKSLGPDFPFFLMQLRPGEAVAIPSNSQHVVTSQDPGRIGMNFFLEPKHGKMQWPAAPANFFNTASRDHLVLRTLWVRTIRDMWETRAPDAPTFQLHGERQELV